MSPRTLFVAGAHTEIGKTHVACALVRAARGRGLAVDALKPIVSGFDEDDWRDSDPGRLLAALGAAGDRARLEAMSPWRFAAPLAPPTAAEAEGRALRLGDVVVHCRARIARAGADLVLVEGAGGLMSPIAHDGLSLDLQLALGGPCVLVGGAYLGAISHALTALDALRTRGAAPLALILSESGEPEAPAFDGSLALLRRHLGATPLLAARRDGDEAWAGSVLDLMGL